MRVLRQPTDRSDRPSCVGLAQCREPHGLQALPDAVQVVPHRHFALAILVPLSFTTTIPLASRFSLTSRGELVEVSQPLLSP